MVLPNSLSPNSLSRINCKAFIRDEGVPVSIKDRISSIIPPLSNRGTEAGRGGNSLFWGSRETIGVSQSGRVVPQEDPSRIPKKGKKNQRHLYI
jgi:hypothetical protein